MDRQISEVKVGVNVEMFRILAKFHNFGMSLHSNSCISTGRAEVRRRMICLDSLVLSHLRRKHTK